MWRFRVLGPLEVEADDGTLVALGGARQRAVLAVLLLRARTVVSTDVLITSVWGESPPRAAKQALHNAIHGLRALLGPHLLRRAESGGYVLDVDGDSLDLSRFEALVRDAAGREAAERARLLRQALDLWRGAPLPEFVYEPFAPEISRLAELRLVAQREWLAAELEAGRSGELLPDVQALVVENPRDEHLLGLLMRALALAGRAGDARDAYQAYRRRLDEAEGVEPTRELQALNSSIAFCSQARSYRCWARTSAAWRHSSRCASTTRARTAMR
jgi:DNA-binding SARP family transcriptional activator